MTQDMLASSGATRDQTEGLVNYALSIKGVKVAAFFREEGPDTTRISLRSSDELDVARVARRWDGGGHKNAAGLTIDAALPDAVGYLLDDLRQVLGE